MAALRSMEEKGEKLVKLAEEAIGSLEEAEKQLLKAVTAGELADFTTGDPDKDDPKRAEEWGKERTIRAKVIEWLCTDKKALEFITHRGILVRGARIEGVVNLSFAEIRFPLGLLQCGFLNDFYLQHARLKILSLNGSQLRSLFADGVAAKGDVFLGEGFRAEGEVRLLGAKIGGDLACRGGYFSNPKGNALIADRVKVRGSLFLREGFEANGEVRLLGAEIGGNLDCRGGHFANPKGNALITDRVKVRGSLFLREGFEANGEVRLLGAEIRGDLDCGGGVFLNPKGNAFSADRVEVKGSVFLREGFKAEGEVRLPGAKIGGNLECSTGHFSNPKGNALNADRIEVKESVFLREGFKAEGEVRLPGAAIGGDLDCSAGFFSNPNGDAFSADGIEVKGGVFLRDGFEAEGRLSFVEARVEKYFSWRRVRNPERAELDLRDARIKTLDDEKESWPKRLHLNGLVYEQFSGQAPKDVRSRLEWLGLQPDFDPQPYEQLAEVFRKAGQYEEAREVLLEKERRITEKMRSVERFVRRLLFDWTAGYGYRPCRLLLWAIGILLLGWIVYSVALWQGWLVLLPGEPRSGPLRLVPILVSLDAFLPLIDLGTRQLVFFVNLWLKLLEVFQAVFGWFLTALLIQGLIRRFRW